MSHRSRVLLGIACAVAAIVVIAGTHGDGQTNAPGAGFETPLVRDIRLIREVDALKRQVEALTQRVDALEGTVKDLQANGVKPKQP